ncbi:MAG: hypothetical protein HY403_02135 [Elusimicrobia bacterium]|nr:hypothetical protein [Elusimicrobiota bacterium]
MKIGFYTYAGHQMGMGHVYRCLAVERALRAVWPGAEAIFELKEQPEGLHAVERAGSKARVRPAGRVPEGPWDLLFVDQLDVDPAEMRALKANAGCLVSLDDTGAGRYEADLAFNGLYRSRVPPPAGGRTRSYEGFDYLLLDERFSRQSRPATEDMRRILISQGGADTYGLVPRLVERLGAWARKSGAALHALVGPAFRHDEELRRAAAAWPETVKVERGLNDVPGFFSSLDAAVSGAGLTACELAASGVPTLLITGEAKELETAAALAGAGAALDFGSFSPAALDALAEKLAAVGADAGARRRLSDSAKKAIDGGGMARMTALIQGALTP